MRENLKNDNISNINGLIIINKLKGYTSNDVVNVVRKKLNIRKVGHTGTLDPNATGVLPILIGTATKVSKYLIEHNKVYIAKIGLGKQTDTGDAEGNVIYEDKKVKELNEKKIVDVLNSFIGKQMQIPPIYSAIKVNGKKLYEYAREGKEVDIKPREVEVYNIELKKYYDNEITFEVKCSKGTYIRVLCEDIAKKLGTIGYMKELQRTKVDIFNIEDSIYLDDLDANIIKEKIIPIENIFLDKSRIEINNKELQLFLNGVELSYELLNGVYRIYCDNKFIGLGVVKNKLLKRDVVI